MGICGKKNQIFPLDKFGITNRIRNRIFIFANAKAKAIVKNKNHVRKNVSQ
ncbi:hypothetical protein FEM08_18610 [Flavobacterium gilvum]|nr:hypothetical protein FEM08_18610 [Flavobacterium gilvum]